MNVSRKVLICFVCGLFCNCIHSQAPDHGNINCSRASELIQANSNDTTFIILDVRTIKEYKSGHLKNSVLIDFQSPDFKKLVCQYSKEYTFLVYCKGGGRSAKAIAIMKESGFKNLYHLFEGIDGWKEQGYEVVD